MLQYNIWQAQAHMADFGVASPTITRKCGICRNSPDVKYEAKGDDDPKVVAWDAALVGEGT